ncbi:arrestin domain-containing protein 3-like [Venturia canescens]|uniref:arrestin domain-containing protein 3-like n=1 Tax=Venturia canescens TaxID=32260 RepID=UPI001C9CDEFE|nr:arrestin domain-containing protein 3-like [Venturia canescens]
MAQGLQRFQINLDSADNTFAPGEIITGNVIVDLGRPKNIRALKVRIKGTAKVQWSETSGSGKDSETDWYRAEEQYFRLEAVLFGQTANGDSVSLEAGHHAYPFSFCLPHNIPSSFECSDGSVRYSIKAIMDRPWKFDHQVTLAFTVEAPYDLNEVPTATSDVVDEDMDSFCCPLVPCIGMGSMKYHFYLPARGFAVGEAIEAKVKIENGSRSVDVVKLKLNLEQKIKLYARTKTKKHQNTIQKTKQLGPFGHKIETTLNLQVPAVPLSNLKHCGIIDVEYRLAFHIVVSGCHCGTTRHYPIVIGTRTAPSWQSIQHEHVALGLPHRPSHLESENSTVPSAPVVSDTTPSPSERIPFPMPMINQQFGNPASPPPYPMPRANDEFEILNSPGQRDQLYPPPMPGSSSGFQYPMGMTPPIGFISPHAINPTSTMPEIPPPSYDACMKMAQNESTAVTQPPKPKTAP